jgi:hypothetical protein
MADVGSRKEEVRAGDDAKDARWFRLTALREKNALRISLTDGGEKLSALVRAEEEPGVSGRPNRRLKLLESRGLAFDHGLVIADALLRLADGGKIRIDEA